MRIRCGYLLLAVFTLPGCVVFAPEPDWQYPNIARAQVQAQDGVTVSAVVLDDEDASKAFGVNLGAQQIRAIWLEIQNDTDEILHLLPSSLDPDYFSHNEAAYRFHSSFKPKQNRRISDHFHSLEIRNHLRAGDTVSG